MEKKMDMFEKRIIVVMKEDCGGLRVGLHNDAGFRMKRGQQIIGE